jgi:hypothetical protein
MVNRIKIRLSVSLVALALLTANIGSVRAQESEWTVAEAYQLDMVAGPLGRTAILAPDGSKFLYSTRDEMCVYDLQGEGDCFELESIHRELTRLDHESLRWSPDGTYVVGTMDFFRMLLEPDIWRIDAGEGEAEKLTEDFVDRWRIGDDLPRGDILPLFAPDGENSSEMIYFLRISVAEGKPPTLPSVYQIGSDGWDQEEIGVLSSVEPVESPYQVFDWTISRDGSRIAYLMQFRSPTRMGIYVANLDGSDALLVAEDDDLVRTVTLSADGEYLMALKADPGFSQNPDPANSTVSIMSVSGESFPPDPQHYVRTAGWSPDGSAYAYTVYNPLEPETQGLYIANAPGEPGTLVLPGLFIAPTPTEKQGLIWASNNVILLSGSLTLDENNFDVTVVQLEQK